MAQLSKRHVGLNGSTLPGDNVALLKRYKHGNKSDKYSVHIDGHWRQAPGLDSLLRGPSQLSMRDLHHLLMSILIHEDIGHHLLPMLPLGQNMTATALHGMAAPKQIQFQMTIPWTRPSDGQWHRH